MGQFFSHDSCGHLDTHETLDEARESAEKCLDQERDAADDGWSEESMNICYGIVIGSTEITSEEPYDPEKHAGTAECDTVQERGLVNSFEDLEAAIAAVMDDAPKTMVPALLAKAIRVAQEQGCFNGTQGQLDFMTRIISEKGRGYSTVAEIDAEQLEGLLNGEPIHVCGRAASLTVEALNRAGEIGAQVYRDGVEDHIRGKYDA